jgi:hypothetical protein
LISLISWHCLIKKKIGCVNCRWGLFFNFICKCSVCLYILFKPPKSIKNEKRVVVPLKSSCEGTSVHYEKLKRLTKKYIFPRSSFHSTNFTAFETITTTNKSSHRLPNNDMHQAWDLMRKHVHCEAKYKNLRLHKVVGTIWKIMIAFIDLSRRCLQLYKWWRSIEQQSA